MQVLGNNNIHTPHTPVMLHNAESYTPTPPGIM